MSFVKENSKSVWVIVAWSLILTMLMGLVTIQISNAYFDNYSYFFDPVYYSYQNAHLYVRLADEGRLSLAVQEWLGNGRHPLRTVPLILFAPRWLANQMGHMATALPMLAIFLFLFGGTVYQRTRYIPYALACMALFCAIPGMFSPTKGLSAYWLDLPASFLVGAATLCLLNSSGARDLRWLAGFALLASLAALSRYVAAMYAFVICGPVLAYYLLRRWQQEGHLLRAVLLPLGVIGIVISIVAGYFLSMHFQSNVGFYSTFGYALGHGLLRAAYSVIRSMGSFMSIPGGIVLGALGLIQLALFWRDITRDWENFVIGIWFASAIFLFQVLVLRVDGASHTILYAVPLIFLAIVSPIPLGKDSPNYRRLTRLSSVFIVVAVLLGGGATLRNFQLAMQPSPEIQGRKALDMALAEVLSTESRENGPLVWNAYFDEYAWIPTMEAFYRFGEFPLPAGQDYFFTVHETTWKGDYPGLTPDEVSKLVYENTNQWVEIAVVFDDPTAADTRFNNDYSRTVARYMAQVMRSDTQWERLFVVESSRYGRLAGYRNLTARHNGIYERKLQGQGPVQP